MILMLDMKVHVDTSFRWGLNRFERPAWSTGELLLTLCLISFRIEYFKVYLFRSASYVESVAACLYGEVDRRRNASRKLKSL